MTMVRPVTWTLIVLGCAACAIVGVGCFTLMAVWGMLEPRH